MKRAYALDALRGFAVLTMILSGTIAYRILPAWMYHAQEPPPNHTFNPNLPGLTWVDIVFPLFLFSMGAAIPLALSRRLAKGASTLEVILYILKRGFLLGTFAIVLQHLRPSVISQEGTPAKWLIALWGFLLLFFMFVRLPNSWKQWQRIMLNSLAWISAIILLLQLRYPDGSGFLLTRSDIILVVLTNTAVFGSLIWLFTRSHLWWRVGCLALLFALRLSATIPNTWTALIWSNSPIPWLFRFEYLLYLFVLIPGTIAGELILAWSKNTTNFDVENSDENVNIKKEIPFPLQWNNNRFYAIIILLLANCLMLLIGLQARWVWQTTLVSIVIAWVSYFLFVKPNNETEYLLNKLYNWGVYWLVIGLLFEPFQGGIKKTPSTFSYYFITTAISIFILIALIVLIDVFNQKKWLKIFIENGQNPMIAYVGFANLVWPILVLTRIDNWFIQNINIPGMGFIKGLVYTTLVACIVSLFTRLKLFWRT